MPTVQTYEQALSEVELVHKKIKLPLFAHREQEEEFKKLRETDPFDPSPWIKSASITQQVPVVAVELASWIEVGLYDELVVPAFTVDSVSLTRALERYYGEKALQAKRLAAPRINARRAAEYNRSK